LFSKSVVTLLVFRHESRAADIGRAADQLRGGQE
jgi:hypothetical protein